MDIKERKYAPRDVSKGKKTRAVNIALDPLTRMTLELAARLAGKSIARYVVDAAMGEVTRDSQRFNQQMTEHGLLTVETNGTIETTAKLLLADSEARTFMRMAFIAGNLLDEREVKLFQRIYNSSEFWFSDPSKHLAILPDGSEPKSPVINWKALELSWDQLTSPSKSDLEKGKRLLETLKSNKGK